MNTKILFIEDEPHLQTIFSAALEKEKFAVVQAYDGERGLQLAKESKPDLIVLDLVLPKKDGFAVLEDLKKNPETKGIPVIILTNLERSEDIEKTIALGAVTYLVKTNYEIKDIIEKIKKTLASENT